jgi:hypothetical protein
MLTIPGRKTRFCDGISRRAWFQIGGLALGGMSLPQMLRAERKSGASNRAKGIIMILLPGGPSHLDMYDLKPDAPSEIRGEFRPISTNVPGIEFCEHLPNLASIADKLTVIRSLTGFLNDHNTHWCTTGWESHPAMPASPVVPGFPAGDWPSIGAVMSHTLGTRVRGVPPSVDLSPVDPDARFILRTAPGQGGFLGPAHAGFEVGTVDPKSIVLNGVSLDRLADRRNLLASFDRFRRGVERERQEADAGLTIDSGLDEFHDQAFEVLTSPQLAEALDLSNESPDIVRRYGLQDSYPNERDGKTLLDQFLLARRVIEAGARCVTLSFSRWPFGRMLQGDYNWDWHKDNFQEGRAALPLFDLGLATLIRDLDERGMLDDVAVVAWGEFGRTPKINANAGRDHWPGVGGALVAGGGMQTGQAIGSTTKWGEEPKTRPVHFREVFATLYERMGIDSEATQLRDLNGRPQFLVGEHRPLPELM